MHPWELVARGASLQRNVKAKLDRSGNFVPNGRESL